MTGVTTTAPDDRDQDYYNIVFNTPDLISNLNMNLKEQSFYKNHLCLMSLLGQLRVFYKCEQNS